MGHSPASEVRSWIACISPEKHATTATGGDHDATIHELPITGASHSVRLC